MGRDEKYHPRERHLYALIFSGRRCYVGQTVDTRRRWNQHRALWRQPFTPVVLASLVGTHADAEEHEYAWRIAAHQRGWRVYGKPGVFVNPMRRAHGRRWALARACRWPEGIGAPRGRFRGLWVGFWVLVVLAALAWAFHAGPLRPFAPALERWAPFQVSIDNRSVSREK